MTDVLADRLPRLCIFARAPVLGQVKTRLAAALGPQAALRAHVRLVLDTLDRLAEIPGVQCELWVAGAMEVPVIEEWRAERSLTVHEQVGADLGERMAHALATCLDANRKGLIVGCDCPTVTGAYIDRAVAALDHHDLVLGPAEDGGYGLIGLRKLAPELFNDMCWGSSGIFAETIKRANDSGLSWAALETLWDVDNERDWRRFLTLRN